MGESTKPPLKLRFDRRVRLEFRGATITSDAGLLAARELDEALGLTEMTPSHLEESRTGRNVQHQFVPLLRQAVYSRLAGYEDTNDAERLAQDPAMRVIVGCQRLRERIPGQLSLSGSRILPSNTAECQAFADVASPSVEQAPHRPKLPCGVESFYGLAVHIQYLCLFVTLCSSLGV